MLRNLLSSIPFYLASLPFTWSHWNTGGPCWSFLKSCFICILLLLTPLLPGCFSKTRDRDKSPKRVLTKRALKCLIAVKEGSTSLTTPLTSWNRLYLDGGLGGTGVTKGQNFSTLLWSSSVPVSWLPQVIKQRPQDSSQAICLTIGRNTPFFSILSIEALAFRATPKQGFWTPLAASGFLWTIFKYPSSIYPLTSPISILNSSLPISPLLQICDYEDSNT